MQPVQWWSIITVRKDSSTEVNYLAGELPPGWNQRSYIREQRKLDEIGFYLTWRRVCFVSSTCPRQAIYDWIPLQLSIYIKGGALSESQLRWNLALNGYTHSTDDEDDETEKFYYYTWEKWRNCFLLNSSQIHSYIHSVWLSTKSRRSSDSSNRLKYAGINFVL